MQQQSYAPQQDLPATQVKPVNYASAELKKE
jgi:hypothetical protein